MNNVTHDKIENMPVAVLGAGHAGRALAGYLALHGLEVNLFNRTLSHIGKIAKSRSIQVRGVIEGFAPLRVATNDIAEAINDAGIIIISVPAQAHKYFARQMAPYLQTGQVVLLMPGRTGGAMEFAQTLEVFSCEADIILGEAQTFSFVSRIIDDTTILISKIKKSVRISALPALDNQYLMDALSHLPLRFELANDVLETGIDNIGAMLHPTPTILCAGLLESRHGGYNHYHEGISPTVGRLIEKIDSERVEVAYAYSARPMTLLQWLQYSYGAKGDTLYECIRNIDAYNNIGSPPTLMHRYVLEDVPTGLVPIAYLGRLAGVRTPVIDSVINLACHLYEIDFWNTGRALTDMGISGFTVDNVMEYVRTGKRVDRISSIEDLLGIHSMEVNEE